MHAKYDATCRCVWTNFDTDIIEIGTSLFKVFKPVAHFVRRLKFERDLQDFYYSEVYDVPDFVNIKKIYIALSDGLWRGVGSTEKYYWPCGKENVFYIDTDSDSHRVFRGCDGEREIDSLLA
ncbi:hypothetical protein BDW02DRAFT_570509 [Decorospora gaudefroyi]|uniref:Uncharacterized protein n=1 Tax=Decorospora gaudefroyi TaxID=184978 RepID=A0A6A5K8Q5_9PLEO|nr:hypothetical protein BDW02DRAFT_570509 [Decorospora gaudefroyi]